MLKIQMARASTPADAENTGGAPDYSRKDCWYKIPEITKEFDTFFIHPTEYLASDESDPDYAALDNPDMVDGVKNIDHRFMASVYEDSTTAITRSIITTSGTTCRNALRHIYHESQNTIRNSEYLAKLDRSFDQLYAGKGQEHELIEEYKIRRKYNAVYRFEGDGEGHRSAEGRNQVRTRKADHNPEQERNLSDGGHGGFI